MIPKGQTVAAADYSSVPDGDSYQLVSSNTVETIDIDRYDDKTRFLELQIVRYLVKAMRTNRKDKAGTINVKLKVDGRVKPISITSRAEEGRLIYLPDMSYYAGAITWLINHISERVEQADTIGETFTLPLEPLISMAKDISLSDASAGGYMNNAIQSLQRISATTFDMRDLYGQDHSTIKDIEMYYKLFRLEALVTYEDEKKIEKKAAVVQFPRSTVKNIIAAVRAEKSLNEMLLIDSDIFATKNEIEILIKESIPDAFVTIEDLKGDGEHYSATVISKSFQGISRVMQHKMIYDSLKGRMGNELHALMLKTKTE